MILAHHGGEAALIAARGGISAVAPILLLLRARLAELLGRGGRRNDL